MKNINPPAATGVLTAGERQRAPGARAASPGAATPLSPAALHAWRFVITLCIAVSQCHPRTVRKKRCIQCSGLAGHEALPSSHPFRVTVRFQWAFALESFQIQLYLVNYFMLGFSLLCSRHLWHIKHSKAVYFKVCLPSYAAWSIPVQGEWNHH